MNLIIQDDIDQTSDVELAFGTIRCLCPEKDIPEVFRRSVYSGTLYGKLVTSWYTGDPMPALEISFNPGFREDGKALQKFIMAHLKSFDPGHEHKMAGCAYLLSQVITLTE